MSEPIDARVFMLMMAARMVGNYVYFWGGESSREGGFDCSGFACDALMKTARAWPTLYDGGRNTAAGLYDYYDSRACPDITTVAELEPGCLVFYRGSSDSIYHVAIHVADVPPIETPSGRLETGPIAFESGGGGRTSTSPRAALKQSAGVRLTASDIHGSAGWVAKDPFVVLGG